MKMNMFVDAVKDVQLETLTENGMKTFDSSKSNLVDLFFAIGASRGKDLSAEFHRALAEDETLALRMLMWARDVRGGAGEREVVRKVLLGLERKNPNVLKRVLPHLAEFGRWDDLLIFEHDPEIKSMAFDLIHAALKSGNGLCAKWMPRKGEKAAELRNALGMTPKTYRKTLVNLTKVVEQNMCANEWTDINYSHVPSLAASRYQKAFKKHDPKGYEAYKAKLSTGEAKVNAGAVYPYDVIKARTFGGDDTVIQAQWDALPNYIGDQLVLPVVDVSGSMSSPVGGNKNLTCMDVSVSLGLYLADKNTGPFKDMFLTFSDRSKIEVLKGNLISKLDQLQQAEWGMSTNLHSAFDSILKYAVKGKVAAEDMPRYILILSDMEFNQCIHYDDSAMQMIERKYEKAGYAVPKIVFWNLHARAGNVPVKHNDKGVALVSGFSPAIMTSILAAEDFNPTAVMLKTLNNSRYAVIQ
jgi:Domain of unknown function (DUF2828)